MKRLTVICMILLLCLQAFSGAVVYGAAEADNIVVDNYWLGISTATILEGQSFDLKLICSNKSADALSDIYASIDSDSSFYGSPSSNVKVCSALTGSAVSVTADTPIKLVYKGKGHELNLTLNYKSGGTSYTESKTIYISQAQPTSTSSSSDSTPADTSKFVPKLGTTSGNSIPIITAGSTETVTYPVKNNSIYQARDITATLKMVDDAKAPLVLDNLDLREPIDQIDGNTSKNVSFKIGVLRSAPEGLYSMKLNYSFKSAYGDNFEQSETVYFRVKNENSVPKLVLDDVAVKEKNSTSLKLELKIKNLGNMPAKDIKFSLKGLKSGGFTIYNSTEVRFLPKMAGNSAETITYQLQIPAASASASNDLSLKMDYKDDGGTAYTDENQFFVPVTQDEKSKPSIEFGSIASPTDVLKVNQNFKVSLSLINNGGSAAKNVKVSMTTDKEIVAKSMNPVYFDKLGAKGRKEVSFTLFATSDAVTKNYPLAINVEYEDANGGKYTATQYVGAYVEHKTADAASASKSVPKVIIDRYTIDPESVLASSDFTVKMDFLNTSRTMPITNIKITVTSDDGTFTPTDSGNSFFLDSIPCKGRAGRELTMHVKPDAEQKSYNLTVNFEYEDNKGNPFTSKETISVRVLQNTRLQTGEISMPPQSIIGQPLSVNVDFYNMGKSTLYNMMVKADGDFTGENLNYYVGNFASGSTDSYSGSITPTKPGALKGNIVFSFEDVNGKVTEIKKEFTVNITPAPKMPALDASGKPIGDMNGMKVASAKKTNILTYAIPAAAILVLGVVIFIIIRKRRARRKEMDLDE